MTASDPSPRPRLTTAPADPPEHDVGEVSETSPTRYPAPAYPYDDGSPLAVWQRQADDYAAAQQLRVLTQQAEDWKNAQHAAALADAERAMQLARARAELAALGVPGYTAPEPAPAPSGDRPRHSAPDRPADVEDQGDDDGEAASLEAAAAALFRIVPGVTRDDLQTILRTNSYRAKKLHAERPGAGR